MNKIIKFLMFINSKIMYKKIGTDFNTYNFGKNIKIGRNCVISKKVLLEKNITIGDCTYVSENTSIFSNVKIGKYCSIAPNVFIAPGEHNTNNITTHPVVYNKIWRKKLNIKEQDNFQNSIGKLDETTVIGNDVWIAWNSFIKRGITIGDGAVIGAGSIVTKNVEPYSIVAGNPATILRYRFSKSDINFLECTKWWDMNSSDLEKIMPTLNDINEYKKIREKIK